ncbi:hypothetical protein BV25DRAFT_1818339 [Artomyces pyxidatus]|uniref:Uncharacterized protein n=1 Tax=Artomyces pyxidatus TaxID=48021 RepID=A0ACB8THW7_9AGAM|nr:hypothetical protein BV25DRAFT_1818339 [Artomyces pyxidatus]
MSTISPDAPLKGGCFCGAVSYTVTAPPTLSSYCHCTQCQRLNASPFMHSIHFPDAAFAWTHTTAPDPFASPPGLDTYVNPSRPHKTRFRCTACGGTVASLNAKTHHVSVWGAQLARDADGRIIRWEEVRPTAHIFYGTRMLDIDDGLGKWEGYAGQSERIG